MAAASAPQDDLVVVGRVLGVFGVQGWVKVFSYTRTPETIGDYREWWLKTPTGDWQSYRVATVRAQNRSIVAQLADVADRDTAATLIGRDIAVPRERLPVLPAGEYYWAQLEGLRVINTAGVELGKVSALFETGANDVLVVQGERERLIPYIAQVVQSVDIAQGTIRVEWDADF